jgi:hypothetical protein
MMKDTAADKKDTHECYMAVLVKYGLMNLA